MMFSATESTERFGRGVISLASPVRAKAILQVLGSVALFECQGNPMGIMKLVCSWCDRVMREGDPKLPVSHGLCPSCAERLEQETA